MNSPVRKTLKKADAERSATARLSRQYNIISLERRALERQTKEVQNEVDRFVRHSAEETHRLNSGLQRMQSDAYKVQGEVSRLEQAILDMEDLCHDAAHKNELAMTELTSVKQETEDMAVQLQRFIHSTRSNMQLIQNSLFETETELAELSRARQVAGGPMLHLVH